MTNEGRARSRTPGGVFLTIGVVFLAVGRAGQQVFTTIGGIFTALGLVLLVLPPQVGQAK
ncbi:MAG TPA: hypothetical protein VKG01_09130 [Thermoanaerobaculia bacterium]|nr:hypothetical protein [Thermoanaerobaculia bacterium]